MGARILVVEDDAPCAQTLARLLGALCAVTLAATAAAAASLMNAERWLAVLLDVGLPDGDGLDLLAVAREAGFAGAVLVLTGFEVGHVANRAFDLGAELAIKPVDAGRITGWARRVTQPDDAWLEVELRAWQRRYGLTEGELHVLELAVQMNDRKEIAAARAVGLEAVKSMIGRLLEKTGDKSLQDAAMRVLWGMFSRRRP